MGVVRRILPLIIGLACFGLTWQYLQAPSTPRKGVRITLSATTPMSAVHQLFYDTTGHGFGPQWVVSSTARPSLSSQDLVFELPRLKQLHGLRLDPGDHRTTILLHSIRFDGPFRSVVWNAEDIVEHFTLLHALDTLRTIPHENAVVLTCNGTDPFLATNGDLQKAIGTVLDPWRPVMAPFILAALAALFAAFFLHRVLRMKRIRFVRPIASGSIGILGPLFSLAAAFAIFYFARALLDLIRFEEHVTQIAVSGSFPKDDDVHVFYADKPNGFTRDALVRHPIAGNRGGQLANFSLPVRSDLHYLRFDPGMFQDTLWLDSLTIRVGEAQVNWSAEALYERLVPNVHVASVDLEQGRFRVITRGNDPFFTVDEDLAPICAELRLRSGNGPLPALIATIIALFFLLGSGRTFGKWIDRKDVALTDKLVIIGSAVVVIAPFITALTGTEPVLQNTEKRVLAEKPPFTLERTLVYPNEFTTYYEENFGLRQLLFRWNSWLIAKVLRTSPLPDRNIFGKDGWMFYMREDAIPRYESICELTEDQLTTVATRMEERRTWLAAQGIDYVLMIPPEKATIYPDKLPSRIERLQTPSCLDLLIMSIKEHTRITMVDIRKELKDARAFVDVYYPTDTHWNPVGAWFGYAALINAVREVRPDVAPPVPFDRYDMHPDTNDQADLTTLIGLNDVYPRITPLLVPHDPLFAEDAPPGSYASSGFLKYPPVVKEVKNSKAPRLLMFRDSFGVYMIPSVSEHFSRSAYVWTPVFIPQIVAEERPDVVVHEVMEFYLSDLLQDDLPLPPLSVTP